MNISMDGPRSWSETMAPWSFLRIMRWHRFTVIRRLWKIATGPWCG